MLRFLTMATKKSKVLILIDGLDKFEGSNEERQSMCLFLKNLAAFRAAKLCVPSCPWNIYKDAFWKYPQLKLEDLTRSDIKSYVVDKFNENRYFSQWSISQPNQAIQLVEAISGRAQGVFLWVHMVVRSLSRGLTDGDDARDMMARLKELPSDLEDYFRLIMSRVPQRHLGQASEIFSLALLGSHLVKVYHFSHNDLGHAMPVNENPVDLMDEILRLQQVEERRINARCMGLLEPVSTSLALVPTPLRRIKFLYRTARDFVASPSTQAILLPWQASMFHASIALFKALIALVSSSQRSGWLDKTPRLVCLLNAFEFGRKIPNHSANVDETIFKAQDALEQVLDSTLAMSLKVGHDAISSPRVSRLLQEVIANGMDLVTLALEEGLYSYALTRLNHLTSSTWKLRSAQSPSVSAMHGLCKTGISEAFVAVIRRLFELLTDEGHGKQCAAHYTQCKLPNFQKSMPQTERASRDDASCRVIQASDPI